MLHSKEKGQRSTAMWTEQDEKQLKELQRKKERYNSFESMRDLGIRVGASIEKHTDCIQEFRWDVECLGPSYRKVTINIVLLGAAADYFLTYNDSTKNT